MPPLEYRVSTRSASRNPFAANGPYAQAALALLNDGPGPIPANGKNVILDGHHGRINRRTGKPTTFPTLAEVCKWERRYGNRNIAGRIPRNMICLDVDDYLGHAGAATLSSLKMELGPLPPTTLSTARWNGAGPDGANGIRWFRMPNDYLDVKWPGKAGDGIDILSHYNRYAIVPPSIHPDTGQQYRWYDQADGIELEWPEFTSLPELPKAWCEYLANGAERPTGKVSTVAASISVRDREKWLHDNTRGESCDYMARIGAEWAGKLRAANGAGGIHEAVLHGTNAILGDRVLGHPGGWNEIAELEGLFLDGISSARGAGRKQTAGEEWERLLTGAVDRVCRKAIGNDPCVELEELRGDARPIRKGLVKSFADIDEALVEWLWEMYVALGEISLIDGEKGVGKSTAWLDVAARGSRGDAMPGEDEPALGAFNTLILSPENRAKNVIKPRLRAAGANMNRIFAPEDIKAKRGKVPEMFLLPGSAHLVGDMIVAAKARFLVIDPITAFLEPHIQSHNDASVRTALAPLALELAKLNCAAGFSRNMNKNQGQEAKYRGSGSAAFANLARIHLVAARLPDSFNGNGEFGLYQADVNLTRRVAQALTFSIEDSNVPLDTNGRMVSRIEWHGLAGVGIEELDAPRKPGPDPTAQENVADVLEQMFYKKSTWNVDDAMAELKKAGVSQNDKTVAKARKALNIIAEPVYGPKGGIEKWVWDMKSPKIHRSPRG